MSQTTDSKPQPVQSVHSSKSQIDGNPDFVYRPPTIESLPTSKAEGSIAKQWARGVEISISNFKDYTNQKLQTKTGSLFQLLLKRVMGATEATGVGYGHGTTQKWPPGAPSNTLGHDRENCVITHHTSVTTHKTPA